MASISQGLAPRMTLSFLTSSEGGYLVLLPNLLIAEHHFGLGEEDLLQGFLRVQEVES